MLSVSLFINHNDTAEINIIQHKPTHIKSEVMLLLYFQISRKKKKKLFIASFIMGPSAPSTTQLTYRE